MATINNIYVFVENEELARSTKIPQHPVEKGLPITDTVRKEPKVINIDGKIVDTAQYKYETIVTKLESLHTGGSLISYKGRNVVGNFLIKSFTTSHSNTVWGGADFTMELVEVRIAKSAYDPKKQAITTQSTAPNLTVGTTVVFKGGPVYVSSDAKKAAATRGRSTCKITIINNRSWSIHDYHLISTDGRMVYGWVDKANIEGTGTSGISSVNNSGTQQVTSTGTNKTTIMQNVGKSSKQLIVGSAEFLEKNTVTIENVKYYKKDDLYYPISYVKNITYDGGRSRGKAFPAGTPLYRRSIVTRW